jgi:chemotaxis protein MotB
MMNAAARQLGLVVGLAAGLAAAPALAADPCATLIEQSNAQLDAMRRHAAAIEASVQELSDALHHAEQRNAEQTRQIERLQAELRAQRSRDPDARQQQRQEFFRALRREAPVSSLYEVLPDRLVIASDPVFVFGTGELGAEGQDRLRPLISVLTGLLQQLPEEFPWRVRIEGHSDSRPLRSSRRFDNNWELSSARALGVLEFLAANGVAEDRLSAVGLAATRLRDPGTSKAAHRRNRRIELHLVYVPEEAR